MFWIKTFFCIFSFLKSVEEIGKKPGFFAGYFSIDSIIDDFMSQKECVEYNSNEIILIF